MVGGPGGLYSHAYGAHLFTYVPPTSTRFEQNKHEEKTPRKQPRERDPIHTAAKSSRRHAPIIPQPGIPVDVEAEIRAGAR